MSKARLLSQALRYPEVADLPHHHLSVGLLVLMLDWAFLHRCLILGRPNTSEYIRPMDIIHRTPSLECSQTRSFNNIIKFILVLLAKLFFDSHSINFFQIESARSSCRSPDSLDGQTISNLAHVLANTT